MTNGTIFFICSTSAISALSAVPNYISLISCTERMAKRMQEQKEENRIVAKSRPTATNLVSSVRTSSPSVNSPIASRSPGYSKLQVDRLDYQGNLVQAQVKIPIPTQRRVLKDGKGMLNCFISTGGLAATDQDQKSLNRQEK